MTNLRTGFGFDTHRLGKGANLWLGGIKIDSDLGAIGYSDSDVLIHAIIDALMGAACLGDIGAHFPDNDPAYEGIDSKILLTNTVDLLKQNHFQIVNIDTTINLEKPKLRPHIDNMRTCLAGILGLDVQRVSIKATTGEKMGFVGQREGIAAYANVLLEQIG